MQLADFEVLTFDCYGTLIDWEEGLIQALTPWLARHGRELPRDRILETYAAVETGLEAEHPGQPYPEILAEGLRRLGGAWGLEVAEDEARTFGASVPHWPAFPDSHDALRYLEQHFRLVILSNIDRASFRASEEKLGLRFHRVLTAEDIGSYKPDPRNFDALLHALASDGFQPSRILHT
ncbi:MAG: HAD hydrolase-like protein, partial [Holophagales bacterium]|nr:HAD hydrolase-like protein [Holophagales bacterium]